MNKKKKSSLKLGAASNVNKQRQSCRCEPLAGECPACWGMLYPVDPSHSFGAAHANAQPGAQKEMSEL